MKKVKTKKQWFEVTRATVREPLHKNVWTALKCTGLLIVTLITVLLKLAGYVAMLTLMGLALVLKLIHRFIDWLVKKIK